MIQRSKVSWSLNPDQIIAKKNNPPLGHLGVNLGVNLIRALSLKVPQFALRRIVIRQRLGQGIVGVQTLLEGLRVVVGAFAQGFASDVVFAGDFGRVPAEVVDAALYMWSI